MVGIVEALGLTTLIANAIDKIGAIVERTYRRSRSIADEERKRTVAEELSRLVGPMAKTNAAKLYVEDELTTFVDQRSNHEVWESVTSAAKQALDHLEELTVDVDRCIGEMAKILGVDGQGELLNLFRNQKKLYGEIAVLAQPDVEQAKKLRDGLRTLYHKVVALENKMATGKKPKAPKKA
jgi:hypothetical protein